LILCIDEHGKEYDSETRNAKLSFSFQEVKTVLGNEDLLKWDMDVFE